MGNGKPVQLQILGQLLEAQHRLPKKRKTTLMAILLGLRQKIYQTIVADILQKVKEI